MQSITLQAGLLSLFASAILAEAGMVPVTLFNTYANTARLCRPACLAAVQALCANDVTTPNFHHELLAQPLLYYNNTVQGCYAQLTVVPDHDGHTGLTQQACEKLATDLVTSTSTTKTTGCDDLIGGISGLDKNGETIRYADGNVTTTPVILYGQEGLPADGYKPSTSGTPQKGSVLRPNTLWGVDISACDHSNVTSLSSSSRRDLALHERSLVLGILNSIAAGITAVPAAACLVTAIATPIYGIVLGAEAGPVGAAAGFTGGVAIAVLTGLTCAVTGLISALLTYDAVKNFQEAGNSTSKDPGKARRNIGGSATSQLEIRQPATQGPSYCTSQGIEDVYVTDICLGNAFQHHCAISEQ